MAPPNLLLISNSTNHGRNYFDHVAERLGMFLGETKRVLFVPWAGGDHEAYAARVSTVFAASGYEMNSIHRSDDPVWEVLNAEAIFVGGGNTFRLLTAMYQAGVIGAIRSRAGDGMPYIGSSAGSVVAAPTLKTTNDMPIVEPPSFQALRLIPFQINAHYIDCSEASTHMGETRATRIREFHENNDTPVLGLREGSWLHVAGISVRLEGEAGAKLFRRGEDPVDLMPESSLDFLMT